jgi:hypothetical protein
MSEGAGSRVRDPGAGSPEACRLSSLPAGHPQGYAQCFDNFVADTNAAIDGSEPNGLPTFDDGVRAVKVVYALIRSTDASAWVPPPGTDPSGPVRQAPRPSPSVRYQRGHAVVLPAPLAPTIPVTNPRGI